jgi:hypothetical protein
MTLSTYVELHSGPSPTFWDTITLSPGESLEWSETWLPVQSLPALSLGTDEAALGLVAVGADLELGVLTPRQRLVDLDLWRKSDCTLLWEETALLLAPGEAYTHTLAGLGLDPEEVVLATFEGSHLVAATGGRRCWSHIRLYLPIVQKGPGGGAVGE